MVLNSYAKLNLYLSVLSKRKDNYHNIKTLFERIDLCDRINLKVLPEKEIKIICNDPLVPKGPTNLCFRAAKLLQDKFKIRQGAEIKIIKRIPVGAGLGGGSGNAACVLLGLNKLWKLRLSRKRLASLAKKIGADVAFFIYDVSFAWAEERGDKIRPLTALEKVKLWHILVVPKLHVSTPLIYRNWDKLSGLTMRPPDVKILISRLKDKSREIKAELLFNSLEQVTTKLYPEAERAKSALKKLGLKSILMSGSGPAVFGIVSSKKEAESSSRKLRNLERSWRIFVARTF